MGSRKSSKSYYNYALTPNIKVGVDYQLIIDPGYNATRGPRKFSRPACIGSSEAAAERFRAAPAWGVSLKSRRTDRYLSCPKSSSTIWSGSALTWTGPVKG